MANPTSPLHNNSKNSSFVSNPWFVAPVSGGLGLALGGFGAYALTHKTDSEAANVQTEEPHTDPTDVIQSSQNTSKEMYTDSHANFSVDTDRVPVSDAVNDNMSFSQAFAAARQDVGAGGAFVWHGGVYGTYYANEWNSMTPAERESFSNSFHYGTQSQHANTEYANTEHTTSQIYFDTDEVPLSHAVSDDMTFSQAFAAARQDVGAGGVFVWHGGVYGTYYANEWNSMTAAEQHAFAANIHYGPVPADATSEPTLMVIEQAYDDETGITYAALTDGDDVMVLADVDSDGSYDFFIQDFNGDGEIQDDEVIDISDINLTQADIDNLDTFA